jgi:type VI secretion system secreted protein VgrG
VGHNAKSTIGHNLLLNVSNNRTDTIGQVSVQSAGEYLQLKCGDAQIVLDSGGGIYLQGAHIEMKASAAINGDAGMIQWNCGAAQAAPNPPSSDDDDSDIDAMAAQALTTGAEAAAGAAAAKQS